MPERPNAEPALPKPAREPKPEPLQPSRLFPLAFTLARWFVPAFFRVLGGWRVTGREHVPREGGVIIASNHVSYADPPIIGAAMPRRCWFMAKEQIFRIPVVAQLSRLFLAFPVRVEGSADRAALRHVEQLLALGEAVCIYPEGHVSLDGRLMDLQPGVALMALRTGVPIVPAAILGAGRSLPPPRCIPRHARGGTSVRFGPPLLVSQVPDSIGRREQTEWLTEQLRLAIVRLMAD